VTALAGEPVRAVASLRPVHGHVVGVDSERSEIAKIATQDRAARFSHGDDDRVHGGSSTSERSQCASPTGQMHRDLLDDVARLQEPIRQCVIALTPGKRLDQDDGRDEWWPDTVVPEHRDQRCSVLVPARKASDASRVEDEHAQPARLSGASRRIRRERASARARA